jgi:hypothetical protein
MRECRVNGRRSVVLENAVSQLVVDVLGGSFVDFHLRDQNLNPLVWNNGGDPDTPSQMSHFLCLDRWGFPSEAEAAHGMPYHGEAALVEWRVSAAAAGHAGDRVEMTAHLPLAGLDVRRRIRFSADDAAFIVTEEVTNTNRLGCVFNMVQHPSIGPPFLDDGVLVDANARRGFVIAASRPDPERHAFEWPGARARDGRMIDMRRLRDDEDPNVVAYVIDEPHGWVTAANPARGLLIGYRWNAAEYPWFNAWRRSRGGAPEARGLEFGTTGLDWPHGELVRHGPVFGRPVIAYLDAGQTVGKSFACFLARIPADYGGVSDIRHDTGSLTLVERGPLQRTLTCACPALEA